MGNRDDLLAGALRCLRGKGYAHTTARDIATAAGTSLAAIGYHFGSKEALLNEATFQLFDSWGERFSAIPPTVDDADPIARFEAIWTNVIEAIDADPGLMVASFEAFMQAQRSSTLREQMAAGNRQGRRGLVAIMLGVDEDTVTEEQERSVGAFYSALLNGVVVQYLIDPDTAPTAHDLAAALRTLVTAPTT